MLRCILGTRGQEVAELRFRSRPGSQQNPLSHMLGHKRRGLEREYGPAPMVQESGVAAVPPADVSGCCLTGILGTLCEALSPPSGHTSASR